MEQHKEMIRMAWKFDLIKISNRLKRMS